MLSILDPSRISLIILIIVTIIVFSVLALRTMRDRNAPPTYDELAVELFNDISSDVKDIRKFKESIKEFKLRQQLDLICDDITILLDKVAEKAPESRMTTGKFIHGQLEFITDDILPQYIEMQDTPRYYESADTRMGNGHQAIRTFGTFLHRRIVELEIADEIRYDIAVEMINALNAYNNGETEHS